jgi:hypothetical protein
MQRNQWMDWRRIVIEFSCGLSHRRQFNASSFGKDKDHTYLYVCSRLKVANSMQMTRPLGSCSLGSADGLMEYRMETGLASFNRLTRTPVPAYCRSKWFDGCKQQKKRIRSYKGQSNKLVRTRKQRERCWLVHQPCAFCRKPGKAQPGAFTLWIATLLDDDGCFFRVCRTLQSARLKYAS